MTRTILSWCGELAALAVWSAAIYAAVTVTFAVLGGLP